MILSQPQLDTAGVEASLADKLRQLFANLLQNADDVECPYCAEGTGE